ncbi:hypothetical protein KUTG_02326 [Kutzneria sp. 744]|nr:hypothetical protein KUTG_02326 [Kutzneria sp. 744]
MPTDNVTPQVVDLAPGGAVDGSHTAPTPKNANAPTGPSRPQDAASIRDWQGLPPDALILVPASVSPTPMRSPDGVWAMLVLAVDIIGDTDTDTDTDRAGEVALFGGQWVGEQPPADDPYDGDVVVRLTRPTCPLPRDQVADVEMLLAHHGRWQRVGQWFGVDDSWPDIVAPTAAAVMRLHCDLSESVAGFEAASPPVFPSPMKWSRGGVIELLDAGMVTAGDEVVWHRRNLGVCHTARIRADGALVVADGRAYANPSGATTALGGNHQNGWGAFRRASDGRTLGDLRTELHARRKN